MGAKIIPFDAQNIFDSLLPLAEFLLKAIFLSLAEFFSALFSAVRGTNVQLATAENNKWNNFCPISPAATWLLQTLFSYFTLVTDFKKGAGFR
ncbi:MAG: hypothetical protein IJO68_07030 [Clostridia bacterium]|nr:hypothetical protein [Clostridia bacterium]